MTKTKAWYYNIGAVVLSQPFYFFVQTFFCWIPSPPCVKEGGFCEAKDGRIVQSFTTLPSSLRLPPSLTQGRLCYPSIWYKLFFVSDCKNSLSQLKRTLENICAVFYIFAENSAWWIIPILTILFKNIKIYLIKFCNF